MNLRVIAATAVLLFLIAPLLLGTAGVVRARPQSRTDAPRVDWALTVRSTLLYTLAFNLTFFVQELFLVVPKALTPGLRPTLFHNNHIWEGTHPLANLFQGTGALATMLASLVCMWLLGHGAIRRSANLRLFLLWMAYCGMLMALPQFAIGALSNGSDLGMAMTYFALGEQSRLIIGLLALAAIPFVALWLTRALLAVAERPEQIDTASARTRFVFFSAALPALAGAILSIAFRVPREWIEVVLLPAWVAILGIAWMQAGAWRIEDVHAGGSRSSVTVPLVAVVMLLLVFQLVLRPGIAFY